MQCVILAAGMGRRLGKYTEDNTKCMLKVNGKKLIDYMLESIYDSECEFSRIVMVVGYAREKVIEYLGSSYQGIPIVYVINPIYDKTNNIYSLWLANEYLKEDDTLLLESDLIFEKKILKELLADERKDLAVVSKYNSLIDGTVTILDKDDNILSFVPKSDFNFDDADKYYKTVNIYKFSKNFLNKFYLPFLDAYSKTFGNNEYYEQVLRILVFLKESNLKAYRLTDENWYEIDDSQDLDIASTIFCDDDELAHDKYTSRYGGYWRFKGLKDYCYLVNPYFPNEKYINELKLNFDDLLRDYPSGQSVQRLLAAKMFLCDENEILVGNGAAELIKACVESLNGKFGCIVPTFNEYAERIGSDRVLYFDSSRKNYEYSIDNLIEFAKKCDSLVLINPDNPSGHFLPEEDLITLIKFLKSENKKIIVDESFVDFADKNKRFSLIDSDVLQSYKNLIVIKSISKSYGVPGLRLGILASGNLELLRSIESKLSIWNINSFGEFFLQTIGKYEKDYAVACDKIENARNIFYKELSQINWLRVYVSQSNYFLCELINGVKARDLSVEMLKNNILIKDLNGKKGIPADKEMVRIAIRDKQDNEYLINRLKEMDL